MERNFKVIIYSKWRFAVTFLLSVIFSGFIVFFLNGLGLIGQIIAGVYMISATFISLFTLPKYIAKAILLITSDADGLQVDWIKPYWGNKSKPIQRIRLDEIKSYKYESSYNFSTLKLRLKSGSRVQLHRWYNDDNDDFDKFMTHFKRAIESYNKKKSTTVAIEKEKSIMENKTFLIVIGILIGMIFIATIMLLIFKGMNNMKGIISVLIFLGPLIWVITQIVKGLQKTKIE